MICTVCFQPFFSTICAVIINPIQHITGQNLDGGDSYSVFVVFSLKCVGETLIARQDVAKPIACISITPNIEQE